MVCWCRNNRVSCADSRGVHTEVFTVGRWTLCRRHVLMGGRACSCLYHMFIPHTPVGGSFEDRHHPHGWLHVLWGLDAAEETVRGLHRHARDHMVGGGLSGARVMMRRWGGGGA